MPTPITEEGAITTLTELTNKALLNKRDAIYLETTVADKILTLIAGYQTPASIEKKESTDFRSFERWEDIFNNVFMRVTELEDRCVDRSRVNHEFDVINRRLAKLEAGKP